MSLIGKLMLTIKDTILELYDRLVAFLISVAKEQQKQIEELKSKIG